MISYFNASTLQLLGLVCAVYVVFAIGIIITLYMSDKG